MKTAKPIVLNKHDLQTLKSWANSTTIEARIKERAKIILLAHEGKTNKEIAEYMHTREATIGKWRSRFVQSGLAGLEDLERTGKPREYSAAIEKKILQLLDTKPPEGYSSWNGNLIAEHMGNVSADFVWRVLKKHGIQLQRKHSWCISTDPEFAAKSADIIGLYLDPPNNAVVICVDEKPAIQALERAQGWLKLPNGKAITGYNHEYKRHGTINLFAALEISTGLIKTNQFPRRRRKEFLLFMNDVIKEYEGLQIHVVQDNSSTHKPKNDQWLARHKNIYFHYTPTHASWLNQVEVWFSILTRHALHKANFTSIEKLIEAIERYCEVYNKHAHPFEWTKQKVFQRTFKDKYANLHN
jgi:transposase